ncbi:hypothetical protein A2U01_0109843, partial [Trifolium medium]|nr:hypothetical protein [Trifolium medium]
SNTLAQRALASPSEIRQTNFKVLARNNELPRSASLSLAHRVCPDFEAQA